MPAGHRASGTITIPVTIAFAPASPSMAKAVAFGRETNRARPGNENRNESLMVGTMSLPEGFTFLTHNCLHHQSRRGITNGGLLSILCHFAVVPFFCIEGDGNAWTLSQTEAGVYTH